MNGETVEVLFNVNIPNEHEDGVEPLKSMEGIKTLQREYRAV